MADAEVRVTSETGGQKGKKLAQVGALDPQALLEVARVAGFGADKYERYNFLRGYEWSLSFDALCRHLFAWWSGEDKDPESSLSHMAHVGWHALALIAFEQRQVGTDNRPGHRDEPQGIARCRYIRKTGLLCGYAPESVIHRFDFIGGASFEHEFVA